MMKKAADLFCGAGGTATGMLRAFEEQGVAVDLLAINHWNVAIDTHTRNHPNVRHLCETLDSIDPRKVVAGSKLDYLTASPECTHHSIARGGRPKCDQSRASAWHVVRWAEAVMPERIVVENVKEFADWGPLTRKGKPHKTRKGETFRAFLTALDSLGYKVDHRVLNAADFGDATTRQRLFVQAWRHKKPTWPTPTHSGKWRAAREVIDWKMKGSSIFNRKRPLSPNTMKRIFAGLEKFCGMAFTMTTDQVGRDRATARSVEAPLATLVTKNNLALAEPWLINMRGTQAQQLTSSARSTGEPLPTFTAGGGHIGICDPFLVKFHGAHEGRDEQAAFAARCHSVEDPLKTIDTNNRIGIAEPFVIGQQSPAAPRPVSKPLPTIATSGAIAMVEPYLTKFYGTGAACSVSDPLDTITTRDRFGLCLPQVLIDGEIYYLDILFRMLQPHELKLAMGFPNSYEFAGNKGEQVKQIGNAVAAGVAAALFRNML